MPIPPDNRAPGDSGHVTDHNQIADELTTLVAADAAETARATAAEALLAPKASPALTGTPTAPTAAALTSTTQVATTAYADSAVTAEASRATAAEALKAPLASPALTGNPTAPTQTAGDSSTKLATTAFTAAAVAAARPLATENTYFVSAGTSASDSNDGLSVKTAKATIAGALTAAGSAAAKIIVGYGTFTISAADGNGNAVTLPNANMILQGQGADRTVINISTIVTWGILAQAAYSEVRDLAVQAVTGGTITYGIGVDTPSSPGSAEHCNFRDILVQPAGGTITNCFAVAPAHTGASNIDVAETTFLRCIAVGAANANYLLGNGTSGNILNTTLTDCYSSSAAYGVYATGTTFTWQGGTVQKSSTADFYLSQTKRADIQGFRSETSAAFLVSPAVGGHNSVAVRDVIWQGNSNGSLGPVQSPDGVFINYAQGGTLILDNVQVQSAVGSGVAPCFILASGGSGTAPLAVVANCLAAEALVSQLFSIANGKPCVVTVAGYVQLSNSTGVAVVSTAPVNAVLVTSSSTFNFNGTVRNVMIPLAAAVTAPDIQYFTTVGTATWTKPAGAVTTDVFVLSGGSGGGSGRRGAAGTVRCGGGGGAAGALVSRKFASSDLASTVTVTVGDGGAGGAAVTADSTSGSNGSFGSISSFGTYLAGPLGSTGFGGSATSGAGGLGPFGVAAAAGSGGSASTTGGPGVGVNNGTLGPSGGPSGGGITSADVAGAGAAGGYCYLGGTAGSTAGAAGAVDSTSPTVGTSSGVKGTPGGSPGSGAASITTAAQAGAAAYANSGAGGSGGGASLNGNNSGAGGKGGSGFVLVVSFFQ